LFAAAKAVLLRAVPTRGQSPAFPEALALQIRSDPLEHRYFDFLVDFSAQTMFETEKQCLAASNIEKSRRSLRKRRRVLKKAAGSWRRPSEPGKSRRSLGKGAAVCSSRQAGILRAFPENKDVFQ
jgi:hypothetical protein